MKEKEFEKKCINYARQHGWAAWKNENNGNKGIPDYSLLSPSGKFLLVEFKRPDGTGRLSMEQIHWQQKYPEIIKICYDFDFFQHLILSE